MKKKSIYLSIMLIISSLLFVSSCQKDIYSEPEGASESLQLRVVPSDWCDGGESDPEKFSVLYCNTIGEKKDILIATFGYVTGLEDDMRLATTEFDFWLGTGPVNQGEIYYPFNNPPIGNGIYLFKDVKKIGTHFIVEVTWAEEDFSGCNVFAWEECP